MTVKNKTKKSISALLIILMLLPSVVLFSAPKKANAFWGIGDLVYDAANNATNWLTESFTDITSGSTLVNTGISIKNVAIEVGKEALKMVAKRILAKMTQATINWINSDFHGSPLFLENPQSFFTDIAKSELRTIVDTFGYNNLLYPFGKDFALNAIASYQNQLADNAGYTLSNVMNSAQQNNYRNDFNYGGWNGFLINTQYPQNNYIGFNMIATEKLARAIQGTSQNAAQKVQSLLQQGAGFLSPQMCDPDVNKNYNNGTNEFQKPSFQYNVPLPELTGNYDTNDTSQKYTPSDQAAMAKWDADKATKKATWTANNTCTKPDGTSGLKNTTPGSVAANQIFNALDSPRLSTALDGALGNALGAIFDALIAHFLDKGLNALSSTINPEPTVDNWSYDGNTLGGSTDTAGALNIPQNVSVTVGQTSSTPIFGGTRNYNIQPQSTTSKSIATAMIDVSSSSGNKLSVTGVSAGTTTIVVEDSSTPAQTVTISITVGKIGELMVSLPSILDINPDIPTIAPISGGNGDYSKTTSPNESVAIVIVSGTNLIVVGIGKGTTSIDIKDSSTPAKTIHVPINVRGPNDLVITPQNISVYEGEVYSIPISDGTEPYSIISQQDISTAIAEILPTTPKMLTITGIIPGTSIVMVRDSSSTFKTAYVTITTLVRMGDCFITKLDIQQTDKRTCASMLGQWTANPITR